MDLLGQHHSNGRKLDPVEFVEQGSRVAVRLRVSDPHWPVGVEVFKLFTFRDDDRIVLMQDCVDRDAALAALR